MRLIILFFLMLFSLFFNKQDTINNKTEIKKKLILDRMKLKESFAYDTVKFNDFSEYLLFIPNLKLPLEINNYNDIKDNPYWFTQGNFCNYGPYGCKPLAQVQKNEFVAIIYTGKSSGDELLIFTFDYSGKGIDSAEIFKWIGMGPINEKCSTKIDENLKIEMDYSIIVFSSFDSNDTIEKVHKEFSFEFLKNGKIKFEKFESK